MPIRLVFESALELMGSTQIGTFQVHPQFGEQLVLAQRVQVAAAITAAGLRPEIYPATCYCIIVLHDPVQMDPSGKSKGPPPAVKKVLSMFGSGREEDKLTG